MGNDWLGRDITATPQHERENNVPFYYFTTHLSKIFVLEKVHCNLPSKRFILT
jgi:hypothetical protein